MRTPGRPAVHRDVAELAHRSWATRSYPEALAELLALGWLPCGIGDWAVALRSPGGGHAARVCPFDPAYDAFVALCRRCRGNRYVPRVDLAVPLAGGGSLTVLEFLASAAQPAAVELARRWEQDRGDAELAAVKAAALAVDADHRARVQWWDGIDLNPYNVRLAADGRLVLIDIFCMDGAALYDRVLQDPATVRRAFPTAERLLEIPHIARACRPAALAALRAAWTVRGG